jgi:hypothetical protein
MSNISPGMKVAVLLKGNWQEGTVSRVEIEDGEEYVIGRLIRKPKSKFDELIDFRVHRDFVRTWASPPTSNY